MAKKQICIKMDTELLNQLDTLEGTRTGNIHMAVQAYIQDMAAGSTEVHPGNHHEDEIKYAILEERMKAQGDILEAKQAQINDLEQQVGWLTQEYSKLSLRVLPAPKERRTWKFWKYK